MFSLNFPAGNTGSNIILCGHNVHAFDMRILICEAERCNLTSELQTFVCGFMDTLPSFRQFSSERDSYSQTNLYRDFVEKDYEAHDAVEDVKALAELLTVSGIPLSILTQHTATFSTAVERVRFLKQKNVRLATLRVPLAALSANMLNKIAGSGLKYSHLKLAFRRGGEAALRDLLTEPIPGTRTARVSKDKRILDKIIDHFRQNTNNEI